MASTLVSRLCGHAQLPSCSSHAAALVLLSGRGVGAYVDVAGGILPLGMAMAAPAKQAHGRLQSGTELACPVILVSRGYGDVALTHVSRACVWCLSGNRWHGFEVRLIPATPCPPPARIRPAGIPRHQSTNALETVPQLAIWSSALLRLMSTRAICARRWGVEGCFLRGRVARLSCSCPLGARGIPQEGSA